TGTDVNVVGEAKPTVHLPVLEEIKEECLSTGVPPGVTLHPDGMYMYEGRVYVPPQELHHFHGHITAGHPGETRMINALKQVFAWPKMRAEVQDWIRGCLRCDRVKN